MEAEKIRQAGATLPTIDFSHLKGEEVERVASALARSLTASPVEAVLAQADLIVRLPLDDVLKIKEIAGAVAKCGGWGCG